MSDTFCVLPWYSREIEFKLIRPCCLLPHHHDVTQIQQDLLAGERTAACQKCWDMEAAGGHSRRQQENRSLQKKTGRSLTDLEQDCRDNKHQDLVYQITLNNTCNAACVTCGSYSSSKWADLERRHGKKPSPNRTNPIESLGINYRDAVRINLLGGEPFLYDDLEALFQCLLEHGNQRCYVSFVTNGSIRPSARLQEILSVFPNVDICVSIDGIKSRFEYMRWPTPWSVMLENLALYKTLTKDRVSVSYTISAVNAIYYDETVDWFRTNSLNYNQVMVYHPEWAGLDNMPVEIKQHLRGHRFFGNQARIHGQETPMSVFAENLAQQDHMKKISLSDYMPELAAIIQS
jgi:hypothetical protein